MSNINVIDSILRSYMYSDCNAYSKVERKQVESKVAKIDVGLNNNYLFFVNNILRYNIECSLVSVLKIKDDIIKEHMIIDDSTKSKYPIFTYGRNDIIQSYRMLSLNDNIDDANSSIDTYIWLTFEKGN